MSSIKAGSEASGQEFWDSRRGRIVSRKGGWVIGEAVWNCGYSMMDELVGKVSWFQVLVLNVTGRMPEARLAEWLGAAFICVSWPDHRIWCNHIGSLAGTARATATAGVVAGVLASDSVMYGSLPLVEGVRFIVGALEKRRAGWDVDSIIAQYRPRRSAAPSITGYARPLASGDERIPAMEAVSRKLGYEPGPHLRLAYEVQEAMMKGWNEGMNINGYTSAFMADVGFTTEETYRICSACVNAGVLACYSETADEPPGAFLPLRCEDINYVGVKPRRLP